jgi:hypothetical protein
VPLNVWNDVTQEDALGAWDHFRGSRAICHWTNKHVPLGSQFPFRSLPDKILVLWKCLWAGLWSNRKTLTLDQDSPHRQGDCLHLNQNKCEFGWQLEIRPIAGEQLLYWLWMRGQDHTTRVEPGRKGEPAPVPVCDWLEDDFGITNTSWWIVRSSNVALWSIGIDHSNLWNQ